MLDQTIAVIISVLGVHAILKFAFFFALPYEKRRALLDRTYGDKPSATRTTDRALLAIAIVLGALLVWRGMDGTTFLGGFWIGATLTQVYFHRFKAPLAPDRAPPPVVSPIKTMSYAIQAAPQRAWRELVLMTIVVILSLVLIGRDYL